MRFFTFAFILCLGLLSCKKKHTVNGVNFSETHWDLYFKNGPTFSFYGKTHLYLKSNLSLLNYGLTDTTSGTWRTDDNLHLKLDNGADYTSTYIAPDSLRGILFVNGVNGDWYAKRR